MSLADFDDPAPGRVRLYGKDIPRELFQKMVDENFMLCTNHENCPDCDLKEQWETLQKFADHLSKCHPNEPKWGSIQTPAVPVLGSKSHEDVLEELRTKICMKLDSLPKYAIGDASEQQIAYILTGRGFTYGGYGGSCPYPTFNARMGIEVSQVSNVEKLQKVLDRILLAEKAFNARQ